MKLDQMTKVAREVAAAYRLKNESEGLQPWSLDNYVTGLVGDIGDLSKVIMARSGHRQLDDADGRLRPESASSWATRPRR